MLDARLLRVRVNPKTILNKLAALSQHLWRGYLLPRHTGKALLALSLTLTGCRGLSMAHTNPTPNIDVLRIVADEAALPLLHRLGQNYAPANTVVALDTPSGQPASLIQWLKSDKASFALTYYLPSMSGLWATPIAQDAIAIIAHPTMPINTLSVPQLRSILQGRVTNWQQVGGPDLPITLIVREEGSSAAAVLQQTLLGERMVSSNAQVATTSQMMADLVATMPGAIGYLSMGYLDERLKTMALDDILPTPVTVDSAQYPLRALVAFVGLQEPPQDAYRKFFTWAQSPAGQAVVNARYGRMP